MKKLSIFLTLAICVLFAVSCNKQFDGESADEAIVTLNLTADDLTKAYTDGDGTLAKVLTYKVYLQQGETFVPTQISAKVTVTQYPQALVLRLANSMTYRIACFAQSAAADNAGLFDTTDLDAIAINYDEMLANDDMGDVFCATKEFVATPGMNESVVMHRPFAQINVCAEDYFDYNLSAMSNVLSQVVMTYHDVPNKFGIVTGVAGEDRYVPAHVLSSVQNKTFAAGILGTSRRIGNNLLTLLSMNYLLAEAEGNTMTVDLTFNALDGTQVNSVTVTNVPYRANYRTNLYGLLVTNQMRFSIDISPIFNEPDYNKQY